MLSSKLRLELSLNEYDEHVVCLYTFIMHDLRFG